MNTTAANPFQFSIAAYLTRVGNQVASNLGDLAKGLAHSSDASIFHHTFQTLGSHHFLTEGFSNDFAQWVLASTNRSELAETLASIDIRDYVSISELRADLHRMVADYCLAYPEIATQTALEKFYFCESAEVTLALEPSVQTLAEFRDGLRGLSHDSFHYHFISSRMRLHLRTNDFSHWLGVSLGLEALAYKVNRIDVYTNTLDSARGAILRLIDKELES
jgi:hypothetical protein